MRECQKIRHLLALRPADRSADEQMLVEAHLSACLACATLVQEYAEQDHLINSLPRIRFTPSQRSQLLARIQSEQQGKSNASPAMLLRTAATAIVILIALGAGLRFLIPQRAASPQATASPTQLTTTTTQPSPSLPPTIHPSTPSSPEATALPSPTRTSVPPTATAQPPTPTATPVPPTATAQPPKPTATPIPPTATFPPPPTSTPLPPPTKEPPTARPTKRPSPTPPPLPPPTVTPVPPTSTATATPTSTPSPTKTITPTATVELTLVTTDTTGTEMLIAVQSGQGENPLATHVESPVFSQVGADLEGSIGRMTRENKSGHDPKYYARSKEIDQDE